MIVLVHFLLSNCCKELNLKVKNVFGLNKDY